MDHTRANPKSPEVEEEQAIKEYMRKHGFEETDDPTGKGLELADWGSPASKKFFGTEHTILDRKIRALQAKVERVLGGTAIVNKHGRVIPLRETPFQRYEPLVSLVTGYIYWEIRIPLKEYSIPYYFKLRKEAFTQFMPEERREELRRRAEELIKRIQEERARG